MKASRARLLMSLYPPFLLNRIVVKRVSEDFLSVDVVVKKSFLNRNLQGSIFGGTIFSASDPFFALMYWQALKLKGIKCEAWLKSAEIKFKKPAKTDLRLEFRLKDSDIEEAQIALKEHGRFQRSHKLEILDKSGEVCAEVQGVAFLRRRA